MLHAKDGRNWPKFLSSNTQDFIEVAMEGRLA